MAISHILSQPVVQVWEALVTAVYFAIPVFAMRFRAFITSILPCHRTHGQYIALPMKSVIISAQGIHTGVVGLYPMERLGGLIPVLQEKEPAVLPRNQEKGL